MDFRLIQNSYAKLYEFYSALSNEYANTHKIDWMKAELVKANLVSDPMVDRDCMFGLIDAMFDYVKFFEQGKQVSYNFWNPCVWGYNQISKHQNKMTDDEFSTIITSFGEYQRSLNIPDDIEKPVIAALLQALESLEKYQMSLQPIAMA